LTRLFDEVEKDHGHHPDILVVNAGYGKRTSNILDISIEEWDYTINVNLRSSFIITKLAMPHMLEKRWGRVVYISSIAAGGTSINGCHYSASKAGVQGLSKNLANKLGKDGITFNDVAPAMITGTGMIPTEENLKGTPGDVKVCRRYPDGVTCCSHVTDISSKEHPRRTGRVDSGMCQRCDDALPNRVPDWAEHTALGWAEVSGVIDVRGGDGRLEKSSRRVRVVDTNITPMKVVAVVLLVQLSTRRAGV